ncbi:MAG: DNA-binding transcriptional LysR family regulator [Oceanospirillaceae bacterium]|jgi:DNA-binding transcriptional LysR family regulator
MHWDDMKIFLAIAQTGGLKKAALKLAIHHTSCARRIKNLETQLGVALFHRLPAGYQLTETGDQLYLSCSIIQDEFHAIERDILGKDLRISGDLCLTLPNGFATHLLMPDLEKFMALYPDVNLKIIMSYEHKDLASREADVAIRHVNEPPDSLMGKRVGRIYKSAYASNEYLAAHDLKKQPQTCAWLGWGDRRNHLKWAEKAKHPSIPVKGNMYSDVLQLSALQAHIGIASLPCFIGDKALGVSRIPQAEAIAGEWVWVLAHKDMAKNTRVRVLIDFLAKAFSSHKNALSGVLENELGA